MQLLVITATKKEQGPVTEGRAMGIRESLAVPQGEGRERRDDVVAPSRQVQWRRASPGRGDNNAVLTSLGRSG